MVKRTVAVLGILSLVILMAGPSMAQMRWPFSFPCFGDELVPRPVFVPVDCPEAPQKTIVKKWECKIEGPCPPPGPHAAVGLPGTDDRVGFLFSLANAIATPFDMLFAPFDGVYGCLEMGTGPCGGIMGPVPTALSSLVYFWYPTGNSFFGGLW